MSHSSGKSKLSFPKFNLKDQRGSKQSCQLCNSTFNVFKMQHLCKRCLRSVCADCSPHKVKTYRSDRTIRLHRNCNICNMESAKIKEYIQHNKLSFGKDSDLLYVWQKVIFQRKAIKLKRSKSCLTKYVDLLNLWESLNFSFREFIGRIIEKGNVSDADLINQINNGFDQIESSSYCKNFQGAMYIYLFFLCHCDVENSVNLTIHILELLQKQINRKNMAKIVKNMGFSQIQSYKMKEFMQQNQILLKESASINLLPITISLEIINYTITKSTSLVVLIGCITAFAKRKQSTLKNLQKINLIIYDLLRNPPNINLIEHLGVIDDDLAQKYNDLESSYKFLKEKCDRLENELQSSKTCSKRILNQTSVDNSLDDSKFHFSNQQFGSILISKNQQIIKQKIKNEEISIICNAQKKRLQELQQKSSLMALDLKAKIEEADRLKEQNTNLLKTNNMLIQKMKGLSKLLMDKQQSQIDKNANVFLELQKLEKIDVKKEECIIY